MPEVTYHYTDINVDVEGHQFTFRDIGPGWDNNTDVQRFADQVATALHRRQFTVTVAKET